MKKQNRFVGGFILSLAFVFSTIALPTSAHADQTSIDQIKTSFMQIVSNILNSNILTEQQSAEIIASVAPIMQFPLAVATQTSTTSPKLLVSTDQNTPIANEVIATSGLANNQTMAGSPVALLSFDLTAQGGTTTVKTLSVKITKVASTGSALVSNVYLYAPSGQSIGSAAVVNGIAAFTQLNYAVSASTTAIFTVKADIQNANIPSTLLNASVLASAITAQNSAGTALPAANITGSAVGNTFSFRNVGPQLTLVGVPTIKSTTTNAACSGGIPCGGSYAMYLSTLYVTFDIKATAVGGAVAFPGAASTSPVLGVPGLVTGVNVIISKDGVPALSKAANAQYALIAVACSLPGGVASKCPTYFVGQNNTSEFLVTYTLLIANTSAAKHSYTVQFAGINWTTSAVVAVQTTNSMSAQTAWRTAAVLLP